MTSRGCSESWPGQRWPYDDRGAHHRRSCFAPHLPPHAAGPVPAIRLRMNVRVRHVRSAAPVAVDPIIPCVAEILDEDRLLEELARGFPERSLSEPTSVLEVKYTPRRALSATFEVSDSGVPRIVAVSAGNSEEPGAEPRAGNAPSETRALGGWGAVAWEFPTDPSLPALVRLTDPAAMSGVLRWLAGSAHDVTGCIPVRYVAGRRCVIHVIGQDIDVMARHSTHDHARVEHARLRWLWEHPDRAFRMAEPFGFDDRLQTRFERMVLGERLDTLPGLGRSIPVRALCTELARVHSLSSADAAPRLRRLGPGAILGRIERATTRRLRMAFPACADDLTTYIEAMRTAAGHLPPSPNVTVHGDLHGGNLILDDDGPVFVGLERPAMGDPAFDLALFGTSLFLAALQSGTPVTGAAALIEELPAAYAEITGSPVRGDTYAWHVAAALVGWQADAALQVLAPNADVLTAILLDTAIAVLRDGAQTDALTSFAG